MKEYYTLVLNSTNSVNRTGTAPTYSYYINWDTILPTKYSKYSVNFCFSSFVVTTPFTELYTVNIIFGTTSVYNQAPSQSQFLGFVHPYLASSTACYAVSNLNDNSDVNIRYPTNRLITVTIGNANLSSSTINITDYILTLQFTPIE